MNSVYIDTSVLGPYYWPEPLSTAAEDLVGSIDTPVISSLVEVEMASALSRKVREEGFSRASAEAALQSFRSHVHERYYRAEQLTMRHWQEAGRYLARFDLTLRTLDAIHLAVAMGEDLALATADVRLSRAAEAVGCRVILLRSA